MFAHQNIFSTPIQGDDGIITFEEFLNLIDGLETYEKNERESRDAYNAFDNTGQGFINSTDILEALKCVLSFKPAKDLDDIVRYYRLDPCRRIEFKVIFLCHMNLIE